MALAEKRTRWAIAAGGMLLLLSGCAHRSSVPTTVPAAGLPDDFPLAYYRGLTQAGKAVYRVDKDTSLAVMLVHKGGALARMGHDHVIASHDLAGYIAPSEGVADVAVPLAALSVDESALRVQAKFDTQPTAEDIAGTRSNMVDKVLEVGKFPWARLHVQSAPRPHGATPLEVKLVLHGMEHGYSVAATLDITDQTLKVTGHFLIQQSEFGITPFSVLGGALKVEDEVELRFDIAATRLAN